MERQNNCTRTQVTTATSCDCQPHLFSPEQRWIRKYTRNFNFIPSGVTECNWLFDWCTIWMSTTVWKYDNYFGKIQASRSWLLFVIIISIKTWVYFINRLSIIFNVLTLQLWAMKSSFLTGCDKQHVDHCLHLVCTRVCQYDHHNIYPENWLDHAGVHFWLVVNSLPATHFVVYNILATAYVPKLERIILLGYLWLAITGRRSARKLLSIQMSNCSNTSPPKVPKLWALVDIIKIIMCRLIILPYFPNTRSIL